MASFRTAVAAIIDGGAALTRALDVAFSLTDKDIDPAARVFVERIGALRRQWAKYPSLRPK
eukprot:8183091-Alexandrium_andersonii.AAC.1